MDLFGNFGFLLLQTLNCLIPLIWLGLSITALVMLKNRSLSEIAIVLWAILICILPILGAVAFWIVSPKGNEQDAVG